MLLNDETPFVTHSSFYFRSAEHFSIRIQILFITLLPFLDINLKLNAIAIY